MNYKKTYTQHTLATHIGLILLGIISTGLSVWIIQLIVYNYAQTEYDLLTTYMPGVLLIVFCLWYGVWYTGRFPYHRKIYRRIAGIIIVHCMARYWLTAIQGIGETQSYILLSASMLGRCVRWSPLPQIRKNRFVLLDLLLISCFVILETTPHYPHTIQGERWQSRQPTFVIAYYETEQDWRPQGGTIGIQTHSDNRIQRQQETYTRMDVYTSQDNVLSIYQPIQSISFAHPDNTSPQKVGIITPSGKRYSLSTQESRENTQTQTGYHVSTHTAQALPAQRQELYSQWLYDTVTQSLHREAGESLLGRQAGILKMRLYVLLGDTEMQQALDNMHIYYRLSEGKPVPERLSNHPLTQLPRTAATDENTREASQYGSSFLREQIQRWRSARN